MDELISILQSDNKNQIEDVICPEEESAEIIALLKEYQVKIHFISYLNEICTIHCILSYAPTRYSKLCGNDIVVKYFRMVEKHDSSPTYPDQPTTDFYKEDIELCPKPVRS